MCRGSWPRVLISPSASGRAGADRRQHQLEESQHVAGLGSFEQDARTGLITLSDELCRILGLGAGALTDAAGLLRLVHGDDRHLLREAMERCLADRVPIAVVHRLVLADGTERWAHARASWAVDEMDGRERVFGTVLDITGLKQAEAALEHQAFHDALTGLPTGRW